MKYVIAFLIGGAVGLAAGITVGYQSGYNDAGGISEVRNKMHGECLSENEALRSEVADLRSKLAKLDRD